MIFSFIRGLLGGRTPPLTPPPAKPTPETHLTAPSNDSAEPTVLSFRLVVPNAPQAPQAAKHSRAIKNSEAAKRPRRSMTLRAAGLGSASQRRALRSLEIRTTADLLAADAAEIVQRLELPAAAAGTLRRWQRSIRLSRQLPAMTPREALLIHAVHRGTLRRIAEESSPRLRRDLVRYAMSTAGSRLLGEHPVPTPAQVKGWVEAARKRIEAKAGSPE